MENTPQLWRDYLNVFPHLKKAVKWEPLRQWALSEVWRIELAVGHTMIAKIGKDVNVSEVAIYQKLLIPCELNVPKLYGHYDDHATGVLLMEDLKGQTIEESPHVNYLVQAAKTLSGIRTKATEAIAEGKLRNNDDVSYLVTPKDYLADLMYFMEQTYIEIPQHMIEKALEVLPNHLNRLYEKFPITLTHNDYHPKNLLIHNNRLTVIDWSSAYLSPHLGDLYCLIHSAKQYNMKPDDLIIPFCENMDESLTNDMEWQINIGGICWTIRVVRWLLDHGLKSIPVASDWIPDLISDIGNLLEEL